MTTITITDEDSSITRKVHDEEGEYTDGVTWVQISEVFFTMLQGLGFYFADLNGDGMANMLDEAFDNYLKNQKVEEE